MAELKFPAASIWREFHLETELIDPPVIKLQLKPMFRKDKVRGALPFIADLNKEGVNENDIKALWPIFEQFVPVIMRQVTGWDLTLNGEQIPCNDENKAEWLEPLMWEMVKGEPDDSETEATEGGFDPGDEDAEDKEADLPPGFRFLWTIILKTLTDRKAFLKN